MLRIRTGIGIGIRMSRWALVSVGLALACTPTQGETEATSETTTATTATTTTTDPGAGGSSTAASLSEVTSGSETLPDTASTTGGTTGGTTTGTTSQATATQGTSSGTTAASSSGTTASTTESTDATGSTDATDSSSTSTGGQDDAFGDIIGECGQVFAELDSPGPSIFEVRLDFMDDAFDESDESLLTPGAQEILNDPNAGGSSIISETFAFEVLARCEGAELLKTETEIHYEPEDSKKTDILVAFDGNKVGVSVTRAVKFPPEAEYTLEDGAIIEDKLEEIQISSMNVVPEDAWVKQILVVMAYADQHADVVDTVWQGLSEQTKADSIVYIIVTDGEDTPIYFQ